MNIKKTLNTIMLTCLTYSTLLATDKLSSKNSHVFANYIRQNKNYGYNNASTYNKVETLLSINYRMKLGKHVDAIWLGSEYDSQKGFTLGVVNYDCKVSNKIVIDYLPMALNSIAIEESPFRLVITITDFSERTYSYRPYVDHRIKINGHILDKNTAVVAAFQVERMFQPTEYSTKHAIDQIIYDIKKDLLRKKHKHN